jgi:hypothetical protein
MSGLPEEKKKVTPLNVLGALGLILAIQLFSLWITYQNKPVYVAVGPISVGPFTSSTPAGSAENAFTLVLLVFVTTVAMVWLVRKKLVMSFKTVIFAAVSFSAFALTWFTVDALLSSQSWYSAWYTLPVEVSLSLAPVIVVGYTIYVKNYALLSTAVMSIVGAEVGSFFASTLPLTTALILPLLFGLYDIYAVFRGPLKQLVGTAPAGALASMSVKAGEFTVGLGDIVFYSMLPSLALYYLQPINSLYTIIAVDSGVVLTLYLLTRRRLLPGLPIPMFLGFLVLVLSFY